MLFHDLQHATDIQKYVHLIVNIIILYNENNDHVHSILYTPLL